MRSHFSHSSFTGLAIYRRRPTLSHGHRGFRLSSLGILINASQRPRPWTHLDSLKAVADDVYGRAEKREEEENVQRAEGRLTMESDAGSAVSGAVMSAGDLREEDFDPARKWFEERRAREVVSIPTEKVWNGWSDELDGVSYRYSTVHFIRTKPISVSSPRSTHRHTHQHPICRTSSASSASPHSHSTNVS
jgi:hypothetical protein